MARKRCSGIALVGFVIAALASAAATPAHAAPPNDDFGDARAIHVGSKLRGTVNGAAKQRGEPRHGRRSGARHSVWYRFRASGRVSVLLSTCRSNFDTV